MAALPYIQIYVADYLADTIHLTAEEHGAYLLIIFNYWQTGKPIPENRLQAITRIHDHWEDVKQTLEPFFRVEDGVWIHDRVEEDLQKVKSKSIKASRAGKKSAESRLLKSQGISTNVEHTSERTLNHTDTEADTDTDTYINKAPKGACENKVSTPPYADIVDKYHEVLPELPRIEKMTQTRRNFIKGLWKSDLPDLQHWENFFKFIRQSDFLMGRTSPINGRRPFIANLEWITKPANYVKIYEENYHQ